MKNLSRLLFAILSVLLSTWTFAAEPGNFQVGYSDSDITPPVGLPMWGYGARHSAKATGAMDVLAARAVVIHAGHAKVAIVGLDLGRGPTNPMMSQIRKDIMDRAGIAYVMIAGSHTHHGPVIELTDEVGYGKGTFDEAVAYGRALPGMLTDVILAADKAAQPAQIGVGTHEDLQFNRNRHTKRRPKIVDPRLSVMRFDDTDGNPIAIVVNFAAHPTMSEVTDLRYSGDYPGHMARKVKNELEAGCVFMQGASGDMSVSPPEGIKGPQAFGEFMAGHVLELAAGIDTAPPEKPSVGGRVDSFLFRSRVDFQNTLIQLQYSMAFFPELIRNASRQFIKGIPAELNTVVLNGNIALAGSSGEFFSNHAIRLRDRTYLDHTLFFGYCNGHSLYFPTIEGVSEGGYGADAPVSPAEVGAGEQIMNRALMNIYELSGRIKSPTPRPSQ